MNEHLLIRQLKQLPRVGKLPIEDSVKEYIDSIFSGATTVAGQAAGSFSKNLLDQVAAPVQKVVNTFNSILSPIEKMNSSLGTSTIVTSAIFKNFQNIAEAQTNSFLTAQNFFESSKDLNTLLPGTTALFSMQTDLTNELLGIQTKSTEQLGVQSGNAAAFNTFLLANKESAAGVLDELASTASTIEAATGQTGVLRDMLDAVGATTAVTRMTFRGSADELARAALQANRMGTTLDAVAQSAKSMLDVESQIGAEMEFQLLTGKDISQQTNELRLAAMTGDLDKQLQIQGDLIEENYESLKGNPIAMEAFAKSIGLSTDQVAKQAETIKARNTLLEETAKIPKAKQVELEAIFEEFNVDSIEKLAALKGEEGDRARKALEDTLGSDAEIIKSFNEMIAALDTRTQEQKLQASIDTLSNAITKAFIGEDGTAVKNTIAMQQVAFTKTTDIGKTAIEGAGKSIRDLSKGDFEGIGEAAKELGTQLKNQIKDLFSNTSTQDQIATDFAAIFDKAFAQSKRFSKESLTDNRQP